jgi:hypothetical protein
MTARRHSTKLAKKRSGKRSDTNCGNYPSGSITTVLDALDSDLSTLSLPRRFRSCLGPLKDGPNPSSVVELPRFGGQVIACAFSSEAPGSSRS